MHIELRIWEMCPLLRQLFIDLFIHIKEEAPIIAVFRPNAPFFAASHSTAVYSHAKAPTARHAVGASV